MKRYENWYGYSPNYSRRRATRSYFIQKIAELILLYCLEFSRNLTWSQQINTFYGGNKNVDWNETVVGWIGRAFRKNIGQSNQFVFFSFWIFALCKVWMGCIISRRKELQCTTSVWLLKFRFEHAANVDMCWNVAPFRTWVLIHSEQNLIKGANFGWVNVASLLIWSR